MNSFRLTVLLLVLLISFSACNSSRKCFDTSSRLAHSKDKIAQSLEHLPDPTRLPRTIKPGEEQWSVSSISDWTSGFYPGLLWYMYAYTQEEFWKEQAHRFTMPLEPIKELDWKTHDFGFMMYNSFGNGYRLTQNPEYKAILLQTADSLASLFNPAVGTIHSWPWKVRKNNWPHNSIVDNMMNLELLFWAAKNGGRKELYDIAKTHALTTMKNHFRDDYTAYHVVVYDTLNGQPLQKITDQGYSNESVWARGQAWAIYGFAMTYRETLKPEFLEFAQKLTDAYIKRLPADYVPLWDFDAPGTSEPKDASAAAVAAAGILELIPFVAEEKRARYWEVAIKTLRSLSSEQYLAGPAMDAILLHSTGSKPHNSEVDVPLIYADYYYVEALLKAQKLMKLYPNLCGQE